MHLRYSVNSTECLHCGKRRVARATDRFKWYGNVYLNGKGEANWHFHLLQIRILSLAAIAICYLRQITHTRRTSRLSLQRTKHEARSDSQNVERRTLLAIDTYTTDTFQSRALSISISIWGLLSNQPLIANMYATQSNHPSQLTRLTRLTRLNEAVLMTCNVPHNCTYYVFLWSATAAASTAAAS